MPYQAESIANFFIEAGNRESQPVTNMKLQKLLYFAQGHHLSLRDQELISEDAEAWTYGPVYPDVYHWLKHLGSGPIKQCLKFPFGEKESSPWAAPTEATDVEFLQAIWDFYRDKSAIWLSELSHVPGGPWATAFARGRNSAISKEEMKRYFKAMSGG